MKNKKLIAFFLLFFLWVLIFSMSTVVFAAGVSLTVIPTETKTGLPISGCKLHLCQVAKYEDRNFTLTDEFADSGIDTELLYGDSANDYAGQIVDYVQKNGIKTTVKTSDSEGKAVFANLSPGMYLVFPETKGQIAPFLVRMGTKDLVCEPKAEKPQDPQPTPPPTDPKPNLPQTGQLWWPVMALAISGIALVVIGVLIRRKDRQNQEPEEETDKMQN